MFASTVYTHSNELSGNSVYYKRCWTLLSDGVVCKTLLYNSNAIKYRILETHNRAPAGPDAVTSLAAFFILSEMQK